MGPLTDERPKCLLKIAGLPLIEHTIENLRSIGCDKIFVVTGYKGFLIDLPNINRIENPDFMSNNILHSLMHAREVMEGELVVAYSDIWVEPWIYSQLLDSSGDIVVSADTDWQGYYDGRTDHPISEAENVIFDADNHVIQIGKHLDPNDGHSKPLGEFLGLWKMSSEGTEKFRSTFLNLDFRLGPDDPFQRAKKWRQTYITDLLQEIVDQGSDVSCTLIEKGWAELDTRQDFERLTEIAERQRLSTILAYEGAI